MQSGRGKGVVLVVFGFLGIRVPCPGVGIVTSAVMKVRDVVPVSRGDGECRVLRGSVAGELG